jgi:type II secretory pathway component PulF
MKFGPPARRLITAGIDRSVDRSLDHSIDVDPLKGRIRFAGFRATRTGDRVLRLIHILLVNKCLLPKALQRLGQAPLPRSLRKLFQQLQRDVAEDVFAKVLEKHERRFGTVAVQMVRMGEPLRGIAGSIERYLTLRADIGRSGGLFACRVFCRRTRIFAATLGAAFEISGDLPSAIRCAAAELPRRYQAGMSDCLEQVLRGKSMRQALPIRGLFSPGFELGFIHLADLGAKESSLAAIMQHCLEM